MNHNKKSDSRTIRVFISSTFCDMQQERDILIKKIFPQLRKLCEERAVTWTEVDLRWGITSEEASEGKVLPLCMAEIQRCHPYFIGLLGERYGWIPEDNEIKEDLLETQSWILDHPGHSVTELEIIKGVLREPVMTDRSFFYFRDPLYVERIPEISRKDFISENNQSHIKLENLKQSIRDAYKTGKLMVAPRENYTDPDTLGEKVLEDFSTLIEKLYPKEQLPDLLDQEAFSHEAYATSRRIAFVGRRELLKQIDDHMLIEGANPIVLTGCSGCGKSALLAEWSARWMEKNPQDLVIQHYIGSTPESANWQSLVHRILGELKRSFDIKDKLPLSPDSLRFALQEWLIKVPDKYHVILVLDALNQLSADDPTASQLGWLPLTIPKNIHIILSSLPGESLDVLNRHNITELNIPLFNSSDIVPAAEAYLALFSKKLAKDILTKLEITSAATNALYLRSVLDELRQFGQHEKLTDRADHYLSASNLPDLFDRILSRWHDDFGKNNKYPNLVCRSLCLIASARFGLSEAELHYLLGKESEPFPRRYWTPLFLSIENSMVQISGLLNFGHEYLREAVQRRWLKDNVTALSFNYHLAAYFEKIPIPSDRKIDELPALFMNTSQYGQLKELIADLPTFLKMRKKERWKWELHNYWLTLQGYFDPGEVYRQALSEAKPYSTPEHLAFLYSEVAAFHLVTAYRYADAEPLERSALEIRERVLGPEHPDTLTSMNNLAALLGSKGDDFDEVEPLCRRALEIRNRVLGPEHQDTLSSMTNLAHRLNEKGNYITAESLYRQVLEIETRIFGKEYPPTLISMSNLAMVLEKKGDYSTAEPLLREAIEISNRLRGNEHPDTLLIINNLAFLIHNRSDNVGAGVTYRNTLEDKESLLGKDHPEVLRAKHDYKEAEKLYRQTLQVSITSLGPKHPETLSNMNNLATLLRCKGEYVEAEQLWIQAIIGYFHIMQQNGREHPYFQLVTENYAELLEHTGKSQEQAFAEIQRILGQ
jgi:nephrocystin-3